MAFYQSVVIQPTLMKIACIKLLIMQCSKGGMILVQDHILDDIDPHSDLVRLVVSRRHRCGWVYLGRDKSSGRLWWNGWYWSSWMREAKGILISYGISVSVWNTSFDELSSKDKLL